MEKESFKVNHLRQFCSVINVPPPIVTYVAKPCPVSDWPIKFNGNPQDLFSFLETVTELSESRKVSEQDLFSSAVELFTGNAFIWYRSIKQHVTDWKSLVERLKKDFLPPDNDDNIWSQIKSYKQRKNESILIFIATLENLFSRLSKCPSEVNKIKIIRQNLLPEYITQLALVDVLSVSELSNLCRKLENAKHQNEKRSRSLNVSQLNTTPDSSSSDSHRVQFCKKSKNVNAQNKNKNTTVRSASYSVASSSSDPDMVNTSSSMPRSVENSGKEATSRLVCWNCSGPNHTFHDCRQKRKVFCFKCGNLGVKSPACPKCSKILIGRTRVSGRAVQKFKPRNLFSESDWKKWLLCVKNFYRSTTTNHKVSPSDISDNDSFVCPQISVLNIDLDHTDAWYETMKQKILASPGSFPQWKVEDGFLFKFIPVQLPFSSNLQEWKQVVPRPQRRNIIESCHNPPTCSHLGFYKTLSRLQEQFYWPKMRADVLKFVRSCRVCGAQKSSNTMPLGKMGKEKQVNMPFQTIALDLMGPFPRSKKGHKWLLVVGDWFSKYVLLCPLRSSKSPYIVKYLENEVFLTYGVPQHIICDNGPQFVAKEFRDLAKKYQVQKIWYNAVYSPQCNFVERMNKTVGTAIRTYVKQHTDWDVQLSNIQFALNTSKHEVTGFSPSFLVFGRHIPISGKYYGQVKFSEDFEIMPGDRNSYASELKNLYSVFSEVRKKLHAAYERNSKSYNLRRRDLSFQVGDLVWRRNKVLSNAGINFSAKLAPRFILSSVRKKISNLVYVLVDENGTNAGRWHIKDLKPYQGHTIDDDDTENVSTTSQ
ncbi:uncharacterized protein LOC115883593 [Sitophilus oryzae]|uniref:RNA-directed DNA polymerase n=1 Tax=Sitophilus oryzae TaxID=7048 RepID=A0A6J2Y488_SITOR|nr:uncharacterized protein LOC115883593 [Sitophilus oryzae]